MRIGLAAIASAVLLALTASGCGGDDDSAGGPVEGPGYEAELPDGWSDEGEGGLIGAGVEVSTGASVESVWASEGEVDDVRPNVNVTSDEVPAGTTAEAVAHESLQALVSGEFGGDPGFSGTQIRPVTSTTLGGDPAAQFEITSQAAGVEAQQRFVIAVRGKKSYAVTQTAAASAFAEVEPEFAEILGSWRWAGE